MASDGAAWRTSALRETCFCHPGSGMADAVARRTYKALRLPAISASSPTSFCAGFMHPARLGCSYHFSPDKKIPALGGTNG